MIPGYTISQEIFRSRNRIVYRGIRQKDDKRVILKTPSDQLSESAALAGLNREFEILKILNLARVAKTLELITYEKGVALILEDTGGETLRSLLDAERPLQNAPYARANANDAMNLKSFLRVAIELSTAVAELHQKNVIHKDINPRNIILKTDTLEIELIDFSISSRLTREDHKISHPNVLEGTLAYISPEQTGRMNRAVDYRTDFYSLGITFYEMLTGRLPFYSSDPLELIHWHIARIPQPPSQINSEIPQAISDIVMKLLSKTAEERYNSGFGLKADLELCLSQLETDGIIQNFPPGGHDILDRLNIPQKLYGRETEIRILMQTFDRVCQGAVEIMMVSGYSGIGKTSLINEVHKPIVKQKGYFISGKFDQLNRVVPYSALIQAFQELIRQLLTESAENIILWKERLLETLGFNAQVLIELIPEVELIIGKQPAVPELGSAESQNRFHLVFLRFIDVFAKAEHPLVIFVDDLQWVDTATLKLLETFTISPEIQHLFFIGAYRENEISPGHPLILSLEEMKRSGAKMSHISLPPLGPHDLNQFISDALKLEHATCVPLSVLLMRKTAGNPFFVTQFLKSLYDDGLLEFDYEKNQWQFHLEDIENRRMTDNVLELISARIQKIPSRLQHVLQLASCIGNRFDLYTLSIASENPIHETAGDLWEIVREDLIIPAGEVYESFYSEEQDKTLTFKFLHDRVQQAAYDLIPADEKKEVHLKIGRLLLEKSTISEQEEKIFDIVNQFNLGVDLIQETSARQDLAVLNLRAAKKAKSSTAYNTASSYLKTASQLLGRAWDEDYEFMFTVHIELAESEYLCGRFDEAERYFDLLLQKARTRLDKANVHNLKVLQYESMSRYEEAIRTGHDALQLFGVSFPSDQKAREFALNSELSHIKILMSGRKIESLVDLPVMHDPEIKMQMKLLTNLHTPSYLSADKTLTLLNTATMVRLSLEHGNTEESAYAYVLHAMHAGPIMGDFESAYEFGLLAIRLNERFNDPATRARVLMNFAWNISLWQRPFEECFPITREAFQLGNDNGLFVEATYALFNECWFSMLADSELATTQKICEANLEYTKRIKMHHFASGGPRIILQWSLALQGLTNNPPGFSNSEFDEEEFQRIYHGESLFEMFYFVAKLSVLYTFGKYHEAAKVAKEAVRVIRDYTGTIWDQLTVFYQALTLAELYSEIPPDEQPKILANLKAYQARLMKWAKASPRNFEAQYLIVSSEIVRILESDEQMQLREAAIQSAAKNRCPRESALANELYAKFWLNRKMEKAAATFMTQAVLNYEKWGALAKVNQLQSKYPNLLEGSEVRRFRSKSDSVSVLSTNQPTTYTKASTLDAATVIKAAQAISSEIVLEKLLQTMTKIIIENAAAERGLLIEEKDGENVVQAKSSVKLQDSIPSQSHQHFPASIVNYVKRTKQSLVIADAENDERFANDPYVSEYKPRSIMCVPVVHQSKLIGVFYLENNLITHAFTPSRIEVVQNLSTQAAISLENARLYEEMKQEIAQRKQAEEALRAALHEVELLKNRFQAESVYLQEEIKREHNFEEIVGVSKPIQKVFQSIEKVAKTDSTVLITGETGTGKEIVARAIHNRSSRKDSPLIKVNCAALPAGLIESELFGHEKGAFTGAIARKKGKFELADGGSIFLDEIGELPLETQAKLMRVLQEQEFDRVGGSQTLKVDVRVIAATNRDLELAIKTGVFRSDLYYRLNIFPIPLPPLRDRQEDVPLLTNHFVAKFSWRMGKRIEQVSREAMECLLRNSWPGNVRELANILERAVILCEGGMLQKEHIIGIHVSERPADSELQTLEESERSQILRTLKKTNWVIGGDSGAAKLLGLKRTTLLARMKKLRIERINNNS